MKSDNRLVSGGLGKYIEIGRKTLVIESLALAAAGERMGEEMEAAADIILGSNGKVVITGLGKSGLIGQKIAATLSSTGTPAVFLHAAEALHGDLGIYSPGDPTIVISKSGSTAEIIQLIPTLKEFKSSIIAIVGNMRSPIAKHADIILDGTVVEEADPLGIVPTSSSTVALALGDALASILIAKRQFEKKDFARLHPSGQLGKNLLMQVMEVMHPLKDVAILNEASSIKEAVIEMTEKPLGVAFVLGKDNGLMGIVTDGDIRRYLKNHDDIKNVCVEKIMKRNPVVGFPQMSIGEAIDVMERREQQISVLPIVHAVHKGTLGVFRLHDAYQNYNV